LGGDYDGTMSLPVGLENVSCYQDLLQELSGRGWSRSDLEALAHGNVLRVMRAVEDGASAVWGCHRVREVHAPDSPTNGSLI
ncbi:hypothetical protein DR093_03220, partial [Mycoplasma flocculare]